jgi:hypothetical protein
MGCITKKRVFWDTFLAIRVEDSINKVLQSSGRNLDVTRLICDLTQT